MTSLRVLTVNIHKGFTAFNRRFMLHELREAVRTIGADVVFLQEVLGTHARHASKVANWPETPHYEFLADSLWPQFAYGRNAVYPHGDHGNAVLSKFPIVRYENRDVSIAGPERRGLLHCVLRVPDTATASTPVDALPAPATEPTAPRSATEGAGVREVHAICVHLGLREAHRTRQLELLCHMVNDGMPREAPLVVAGDFNDWRQRADRQLERCAGLREVHVSAHGRAARTFPSRFPMLSLDRIYVRNVRQPVPLALPKRPWSHLSDHAPLAAEIQL